MNDIFNKSPNLSPQTMDNPYIIVPENNEVNRVSITKGTFITFVPLFILIFILAGPCVMFAQLEMPYLIPIVFIPILILLLCCKSRIVLIKDKENNRLTVKEKNYFCCATKTYNIPFEHSDIKTAGYGSESGPCCNHTLSTIIVLNADPNVTDIDNNNIKNTPLNFTYRFSNLIGTNQDLELKLVNFIGNKFNNNIEEEIKLYVPNYNEQRNIALPINFHFPFFGRPTDTFIKISDHFYMFYNYSYLLGKSGKESFQRLDWIYTNDFDRIFIGVVKNDTSYVNTFTYTIESIDKFVLEIREGKLCLKIILKNGFDTEICRYTREKDKDLNTFLYLINGQINKIINGINGNNQDYTEKPEEPGNSAPTLM